MSCLIIGGCETSGFKEADTSAVVAKGGKYQDLVFITNF